MFKWLKRHEHKWIVDYHWYGDKIDIKKTCSICGRQITLFSFCYLQGVDSQFAFEQYLKFAKGIKGQNPEYWVRCIDE